MNFEGRSSLRYDLVHTSADRGIVIGTQVGGREEYPLRKAPERGRAAERETNHEKSKQLMLTIRWRSMRVTN